MLGKHGIKPLSQRPHSLVKHSFSFFPAVYVIFSSVFQGDDRALDLLLLQHAMQRRKLLPCSQQPRALQRYVSLLIYCPPSLMTRSGRDLLVVSVTPTWVNKASLPSHQSGGMEGRHSFPAARTPSGWVSSEPAPGCSITPYPWGLCCTARGQGAALAGPAGRRLQ